MGFTSPFRSGLVVAACAAYLQGCTPPDRGRPDFEGRAYLQIVEAEISRPAGGKALETLTRATRSPLPRLRAAAVRALGRLENPSLIPEIVPALEDEDASVRAEAANALAQAVVNGPGEDALPALLDRGEKEVDDGVLGVVARSLGRLRVEGEAATQIGRTLLRLSRASEGEDAPRPRLIGVALGLESFARQRRGAPLGPALEGRLRELTRHGLEERRQTLTMVRIRSLALQALAHAGRLTTLDLEPSLRDPGDLMRRTAAAHLEAAAPAARSELIRRALLDPFYLVRLEAILATARGPRHDMACLRLSVAARRDESAHVRLAALDGLDRPCRDRDAQIRLLESVAGTLSEKNSSDWHEPAHAAVALAGLAPERAAPFLRELAGHANPFARAWAARGAGRTGDTELLGTLTGDPDANVQTAALTSLVAVAGHSVDTLLVRALAAARDPQQVVFLARALRGTRIRDAARDAAWTALASLTEEGRLTLRDPRVALLELLAEVAEPNSARGPTPGAGPGSAAGPDTGGDSGSVRKMEAYLRDFDPAVAATAAQVLQAWTGERYLAAPSRPRGYPPPTPAELRRMESRRIVLEMARGGEITLRLRPWVAPMNSVRLLRLAQSGALDGLTFHRVVPDFVIQGGSPGANEYAGWGAYTPDEVGLPVQWLGTVGLSTRGHDTGDGQFYVNMGDNVRLDHRYTVFARVESGLETAQAVLEGDVMERVQVRTNP